MVRASRPSAPALAAPAARWFLLAGLAVVGVGCTSETPSTAPPVAEQDKSTLTKVKEEAVEIGKKTENAVGEGLKATGQAIERGGEKLATDAAQSVKDNVGQKAGEIVESAGKGMEKAGQSVDKGGDKLKDAAKPQ